MSRIWGTCQFFIIIGIFLFINNAHAEEIKSYNIEVIVNKDSTLNVVEKIEYDFGATPKHGIYRSIPIKDKNFNIDISNIKITDENGVPYSFTKEYNFDYVLYFSSRFDLKIGDEFKLVNGVKTFVIKYKVAKAIEYLKNKDQLYWNLIGNKWDVPIKNISASIIFPENIDNNKLSFKCFLGELGSKNECAGNFITEGDKTKIQLDNLSELNKKEALTVLISLPKKIISTPTNLQNFLYFVRINFLLFLPVIVFIILFVIRRKRGRDSKGRGTIIPQYDAPNDLRPIEIGTILDETCNNRDIVGEIIYLAIKGYLKIAKLDEEDYLFEKLKDGKDLTSEYDKVILNILFDTDYSGENFNPYLGFNTELYNKSIPKEDKESVKLSDLKLKVNDFSSLRETAYRNLINNKIFINNPERIRRFYFVFSALFFIATIIIIFNTYIGWLNVLGLFISSVVFFYFSLHMPQRSEKGVVIKEYILGLKLYLEVAEKDRINFHNAPEKKPEHFEKLLPYAIVLGVEKEWSKQFEGIYSKPLSWYNAGLRGSFNFGDFSQSLSSFSNSFTSSAFSPSPSGLGGGFAGGGFGGGGGGSW